MQVKICCATDQKKREKKVTLTGRQESDIYPVLRFKEKGGNRGRQGLFSG